MRIVIVGGPRTGKTTEATRLASELACPVHSTDSLIETHAWSDASAEVSRWFTRPGPWVVEGVATVRALRKWLAAHPTGRPCDQIIALHAPRVRRSPRQIGMAKSVLTVWKQVVPQLIERQVRITYK